MYDSPDIQTIHVPRLATITIDPTDDGQPQVEIVLDPDYHGDLNDVEQNNGLPPGVLFRGYYADAINHAELARFMETLHCWDHDGDGDFDGDQISDLIEGALWQQRSQTTVYHRPNRGPLTDLLMRFMPPQPERHIVLGYGELKPRFKPWHYALAIPMLVGVLALANLQFFTVPWTRYSVVSGIGALIQAFGLVVIPILYVAHRVLHMVLGDDGKRPSGHSPFTYGFLNKAAVDEEQAFREGSENWTFWQRVYSCFAFGMIHLGNLYYPIASILPLSIGGAIFMRQYLRVYEQTRFRRSAVLAASVVHRVYNRCALVIVVIALLTTFSLVIIGLLTSVAFLALDQVVDRLAARVSNRFRGQQTLETVSQPATESV